MAPSSPQLAAANESISTGATCCGTPPARGIVSSPAGAKKPTDRPSGREEGVVGFLRTAYRTGGRTTQGPQVERSASLASAVDDGATVGRHDERDMTSAL
jgi:hypothetical protein